MFNRIRLSLTAWYVSVLLGIVVVVGIVTYVAFSRSLANEVDDSLRSSAEGIAGQVSDDDPGGHFPGGSGGDGDGPDDGDGREVRYFTPSGGDTFYYVMGPDGKLLANPSNVDVAGIPDTDAALAVADGRSSFTTVRGDDGNDYRLYSLAVQDEGRTAIIIQVGRSLAEKDRQISGLLIVLGIAGGAGLVLAAGGGLLVAGRALRPVRQSFERQRAFVSDASHEIRTPLTIIRGNAEMLELSPTARLQDEDRLSLEEIVSQSEYMERLVSNLSKLARLDEGRLPIAKEPVEVTPLLDSLARSAHALAPAKQLSVQVDAPQGLVLEADPAHLRELLLALVENAVRHTPDGGRITLHAQDGAAPQISVSDTGPGIEEEHHARIFDRFYRADESRSRERGGTGLGLSIASAIARAHGGTLSVASEPGKGATFTLRLPRGEADTD